MTRVLADAGPLNALAIQSDQHHAEAHADLHRLADVRLSVTVLYSTLVEGYVLVLRRTSPTAAFAWINALQTTATFVMPSEPDFDAAIELVQRFDDQSITLPDAPVAVMSRQLAIPVWSYDHHFDILRVDRWR